MKLCLVTHQHPPNVSTGLGRYSTNLVDMLEKAGHEVTIITHDKRGGASYEKKGRVEVHRLHISKSILMDKLLPNLLDERLLFEKQLKKFFKTFDLNKYDILHILDMRDCLFLNKSIASKIPIIITANDYYPFETSWNIFKFPYFCLDLPLRYINYMYYKLFLPRPMKLADIIIPDTKFAGASINKRVGISNSRIKPIYKGVDYETFYVEGTPDKYTNHKMLYGGSNMERKGVADILKAMPLIIKKFPDAKLTLIGRKSFLFSLQMGYIVWRYKLKGCYEERWYVPSDKIPEYFRSANVFVLAPIIEDLAQIFLESMATKTPVVCTDVDANPEGVVHDETGLLVKPRDPKGIAEAVIKIFSNPEYAKKLGENGRKRVEKMFTKKIMLDRTMEVYKDVLKKSKKK